MKTDLIPQDNLSDLYEVDDEVKKNIEFLPMSNLSQVLAAALLKPKTVSAGHPRTRKVKPAEAAALPQPAEKPQTGSQPISLETALPNDEGIMLGLWQPDSRLQY